VYVEGYAFIILELMALEFCDAVQFLEN